MKNCMFKCLIVAIALNLFVAAYYQIAARLSHPVQPQPIERVLQAGLSSEFVNNDELDFSGTGNVKVKTIFYQGRKYHVFYEFGNDHFVVIPVL